MTQRRELPSASEALCKAVLYWAFAAALALIDCPRWLVCLWAFTGSGCALRWWAIRELEREQ